MKIHVLLIYILLSGFCYLYYFFYPKAGNNNRIRYSANELFYVSFIISY